MVNEKYGGIVKNCRSSSKKTICNDKKRDRKLAHIWTILANPKNYLVLETIEEYKEFFYTPRIKIDDRECYFSKPTEERLNEFIETIRTIDEIKQYVSYNYLKSTVIKTIGEAVKNRLNKEVKPSFDQVENIITALIDSQKTYVFIRAIEGLETEEIKSINLGDSEIFSFDLNYKTKIEQQHKESKALEFYQKVVEPMINKYFLEKMCLRVEVFGEYEKAGDIALKRMKLIINVFRFFLCLFIHKRVYQHIIQINLSHEIYKGGDEVICIGHEDDEIKLSYGRGRKALQPFSISSDLIKELKEKCFFDDIISLIKKDDLSELEGSILTAIYWIGEAQNEFDRDVSFLKYWTALEAVTFNPTDISEALSTSIAVLLVFGGYKFIEIQDIEDVKRLLKKLYEKRSAVIHRGMREVVTSLDIADICKYSTWTVLNLLNLRGKNYAELEQVKKEVDRLYSLKGANPLK